MPWHYFAFMWLLNKGNEPHRPGQMRGGRGGACIGAYGKFKGARAAFSGPPKKFIMQA